MGITAKIFLGQYNPSEIIALHQQGIITLDEIIASGEHYRTFTDALYKYVKVQKKLAEIKQEETLVNTASYDETQGTRMVTIKDRRKMARS
jgi:hypothetical protein